jgi:hypothetical protein
MFAREKKLGVWILIILVIISTLGCNLLSSLGIGDGASEATPTPTILPGGSAGQTGENPCEGLSGSIELQLLVGPSEAVGLEPYTMASVPFEVTMDGEVYLVEGSGQTAFYQDVLEAEWGTYSVQFDGEIRISGTCVGAEAPGTLNLYLEMDGEQTVVVVVEGQEMTYPWAGMPTLMASFPIRDGAQQSGEGWTLILHLN